MTATQTFPPLYIHVLILIRIKKTVYKRLCGQAKIIKYFLMFKILVNFFFNLSKTFSNNN